MDGSKLEWALNWASRGFRVFPLRPGSKQPALQGWTEIATRDETTIRGWWSNDPERNIGVLTDDLVVVDVDVKRGKTGFASLLSLDLPLDALSTLTTESPSGGRHIYFSGANVTLSAGRLGDGLDIRSFHGYVIAPGSYIDERVDPTSGVSGWYRIADGGDLPVQSVPPEILSRLDRVMAQREAIDVTLDTPAIVASAVRFLREEAPAAIEGQGGDLRTYKTAQWIKDLGVSEELAFELISEHYNGRCLPPWGTEELREKVANAYAYGAKPPGVSSPEHQFAGVHITPPEPVNRPPAIWFRHGDDWNRDQGWLYYQMLPLGGVCFLTAPSQAGKTFVLTELARSLATGKPFFGVEPDDVGGTVFLFAGTEGSGFGRRLDALQEGGPLPISAMSVSRLADTGVMAHIVEQVRGEAARMREQFGTSLKLVVLETLSASGLVKDENSAGETADAIGLLAELSKFLGVPILVSHHPDKQGRGARGSGAITNNADYWLEIERSGTQTVRHMWVRKARDANQRKLGAFTLVPVDLGYDSRGRQIVSMTVSQSTSAAAATVPAGKPPPMMDTFNQALGHLYDDPTLEPTPMQDGYEAYSKSELLDRFVLLKEGSKDRNNSAKQLKACVDYALTWGRVDVSLHLGEEYLRKKEII